MPLRLLVVLSLVTLVACGPRERVRLRAPVHATPSHVDPERPIVAEALTAKRVRTYRLQMLGADLAVLFGSVALLKIGDEHNQDLAVAANALARDAARSTASLSGIRVGAMVTAETLVPQPVEPEGAPEPIVAPTVAAA